MPSHHDELAEEVGRNLSVRPGWSLQGSFSPGAPPAWCLVHQGDVELSVGVDGGAICIYEMNDDQEVRVGSPAEMTTWLDAHQEAGRSGPLPVGEIVDELVHGTFTEWGHPGR